MGLGRVLAEMRQSVVLLLVQVYSYLASYIRLFSYLVLADHYPLLGQQVFYLFL